MRSVLHGSSSVTLEQTTFCLPVHGLRLTSHSLNENVMLLVVNRVKKISHIEFDHHAKFVFIVSLIVIHAEHVVHRRGYCFDFGCMFVCLYVSALERKRLIGMT